MNLEKRESLIRRILLVTALLSVVSSTSWAVDLYGATPTAQSIALSGIYFGSLGPTDSLAANPAGLVFTDRPVLELTGMGIFSGGNYRNSTSFDGTLNSGVSPSGSFGFATAVPGTKLHLGVGVFPTALLSGKWQYMDPKGTAGVSYGLQNDKSAFLAIQSAFGAGYEITRFLSLGASFGLVHNINTLETPYIFQTNETLAGLKALLNLHTSGNGYNGTFGAILHPNRRLNLGASYKTRTTVRSTGSADGTVNALFNALGVTQDPSYHYRAQVDNVFPQSASLAIDWQAYRALHLYAQSDWLNWHDAFIDLPVHLTGGDNLVVNSLLASTTLNDSVPLHWRNQLALRGGFSLPVTESVSWQGGYAHTNDPVPSSTLTPLTADIMANALSTGVQYTHLRYRLELAYQANLPTTQSVGLSQLLAGEYNNTRTHLWLQTVALTTGIRF